MFPERPSSVRSAFVVPLLYAVAAFALGLALPRLEDRYLPGLTLGIGPDSAVALLSAIASGTMAFTGIVFSLAFVMVQFSATAYSPRLVLWLARSGVIHHSIGVFCATFVYSLAALAWVGRGGGTRVPPVTCWLAVALLMLSIVFFVLLVERVGTLQVTRILAFTGDRGRVVIDRMYPLAAASPAVTTSRHSDADARSPVSQALDHVGPPACVQALDTDALVALASRAGGVIAMAVAVGDTVMRGLPLLRVHGGRTPLPEAELRKAVVLGPDRTFEQDPKYALRILVDVAIKALSPAINDPTTATQALDQIEDLLLLLGQRRLDVGRFHGADGELRLVISVPAWEDLVVLAFDEIRYCGASSIQVMRRLRATLLDLMPNVAPERRPALQRYLERVDAGIQRSFGEPDDRRDALEEDRQGLGLARARDEPQT